VYGGSGSTGVHAVEYLSLTSSVSQIRVGTRDTVKAKGKFNHIKTPITYFSDLSELGVIEGLKGADAFLIIPPASEDRAQITETCVRAAQQAKIKYIAVISVLPADVMDITFGKQFYVAEKAVRASGIPYSIVRCPFFHENIMGYIQPVKTKCEIYGSSIPDAKYSSMSVVDIGKFCAQLIIHNSKYHGKTFSLTTHQNASQVELCQCLSKALGKEVKYVQVPAETTKTVLISYGVPEWQATGIVELWTLVNENRLNYTTLDFHQVVGHAPTSMEEYIQKVATMFN